MKCIAATLCAVALSVGLAACANTMRGAKQDTEKATENVAAGTETVDVKSA
jgi:predicted small secreted protein